jgi:nitrogen fixation NifU-like protein
MEDLYRENILDHYHNPRNYGTLENPEITHEDSNSICGDEIRLDLRVRDGVIEDVRFSGRGCAISQAAASMLTERIKGLSLEEARNIGKEDVLADMGIRVSPSRLKCALLPLKVFRGGAYGLTDWPGEEEVIAGGLADGHQGSGSGSTARGDGPRT